ncbi:MAG: TIGR04076 family protein [Chloroflexi bacterium]|nr:TIGR04076 family protein [Chloroflexota bacterium]
MAEQHRVIYEVEEVRGSCPVYKVGDKVVIDSRHPVEVLNLEKTDALCMRIIDNMWSQKVWQAGGNATVEHLTGISGECRIGCSMPGKPYTPCGFIIFKIRREKL